jgi:integrase
MRQGYYFRQRKKGGAIHVIFLDPQTGKQIDRTTGTNDEKKAHAIAQSWLAEGLPGKPQKNNIAKSTLFCDYLYQFWDFETSGYFRELETMGRTSHAEHAHEMQMNVERYYRPYFQKTLLSQINEDTLQEFIVHLKVDKKLASSTVNSARNAAIKALRYAKRKKIIHRFDFDAVLRAGGKAKQRGILEKDEVEKLFNLEWPNIHARMAVLISSNTGMRMGEIRALRVCDIHSDRISVNSSWGRKSKMKCTKNAESRDVPILPSLHDEIIKYIRQMGLLKLDSFLFPGKNPEIPYDCKQIGKIFNKMLEKIGIDDKTRRERGIVFHSWMHLLAKNLVEKGANKAIGMKILGHKTSRIFDQYASHVDKETFKQMTEALEMVMKPDTPKEPIPFRGVG